ncbi:Do family serine endopeptidase [Henriciella litoralis]|uniref:Do family serine endopeptidase n=1 Tax=Henriciella litoralis TaxID=568102 RepID=UPI001F2FD7F9|nr:Do family serine endopeptidase [Henriciella litoralis]
MTHTKAMTRHVSKLLFLTAVAVLALLAVVVSPLFSFGQAGAQSNQQVEQAATQSDNFFMPDKRVPQSQAEIQLSYAPLVKTVSPAVVSVYSRKVVRQNASPFANDPVFRQFFGGAPREQVQNSLGSGVIVASDGVIVTNNHVVNGADEFRVVLSDRREYEAELILADERTDLAVLRIDTGGDPLPTVDYADTRDTEVGDIVLAIGNPFGVGQTVTTGIISATARTDVGVSDYAFFLQTDAAVNPGNSGGALINTTGQLVGVNTAIFSRSGGSNGIGFAIPAEMVRRVVDAAVNEGMIVRPWLGLKAQSVSYDIAKAQGLDRPIGVMVTEVFGDGPSDKAGLSRGDLITMIDGREVFDERGLKFLAATRSPGEVSELTVLRGGNLEQVRVTLAPPPGATKAEVELLDGRHPFSGAEVAELSPRLAEELGRDPFDSGILVTRIKQRAYAWRVVRPGDLIVSVNGKKIESLKQLADILEQDTSSWDIELDRNGRSISGTVRL